VWGHYSSLPAVLVSTLTPGVVVVHGWRHVELCSAIGLILKTRVIVKNQMSGIGRMSAIAMLQPSST